MTGVVVRHEGIDSPILFYCMGNTADVHVGSRQGSRHSPHGQHGWSDGWRAAKGMTQATRLHIYIFVRFTINAWASDTSLISVVSPTAIFLHPESSDSYCPGNRGSKSLFIKLGLGRSSQSLNLVQTQLGISEIFYALLAV